MRAAAHCHLHAQTQPPDARRTGRGLRALLPFAQPPARNFDADGTSCPTSSTAASRVQCCSMTRQGNSPVASSWRCGRPRRERTIERDCTSRLCLVRALGLQDEAGIKQAHATQQNHRSCCQGTPSPTCETHRARAHTSRHSCGIAPPCTACGCTHRCR